MPPVRVLLIAPSLDFLGGQAVQAMYLLDGMHKEASVGMDFLPINPRLPRPWSRIRYLRTLANFAVFFARLIASAWRYDVLHVFTASYYGFLLWTTPAVFVARLCGRKVIVNYHDGQCEDHLRNWRSARPPLRLTHEIVAPTDYLVDVMRKFGLQARCIFNVIDTDRFPFRRRDPLRPVFMTNRALEPLYNVACILRGFSIVQRRYPEATLVVAHDGPCRPELEELARTLELRNVTFLGKVTRDRIAALYHDADIYLTTPNIDCMPVSILECYASGLPVIATVAGGIPYILEHEKTGLLIPLDDHEALARAAFRLLEEPGLALRLADAGRRQCELYRWAPVRDRWLALYRRLAEAD